jgi:hypothetical protein
VPSFRFRKQFIHALLLPSGDCTERALLIRIGCSVKGIREIANNRLAFTSITPLCLVLVNCQFCRVVFLHVLSDLRLPDLNLDGHVAQQAMSPIRVHVLAIFPSYLPALILPHKPHEMPHVFPFLALHYEKYFARFQFCLSS